MKALQKLVQTKNSKSSWFTTIALLFGFCLLFISVQLYINATNLLSNTQQKKDGYDYLVVNKKITNAMMGDNARSYFSREEIEQAKKLQAVEQVGLITSNRYGIEANTLGKLAFSTQLFFESVPDDYLDILPENRHWKEGDRTLPVILSADYLNLYNFGFALSQGLPQLSEETIKAIPFNVTIYDKTHEAQFVATVVGFTQRYSSVLVPMEFMQYANTEFGSDKPDATSRIILKTKEADQPQLVKYLDDHGYATQQEKLKGSKLKSIVQLIFGACGFFGCFVLALSFLLLMMYLKLLIIQSSAKLQLLVILGYQPSLLQKQFTRQVARLLITMVFVSISCTAIVQYLISIQLKKFAVILTPFLSWMTIIVALSIGIFIYWLLNRKVKNVMALVVSK